MAITVKRVGFGQVEPNHLSAQRTAQIYAQLPANADIDILENGQFVKYDYANNEVNFTGAGEWMLVFNEVKLYKNFWEESYKDFAMQKKNYTPGDSFDHVGMPKLIGQMVPRVFKTNVGDIYTTNCVGAANVSGDAEYEGIEVKVGDKLSPNAEGFLSPDGDGSIVFQVVKEYTMPDGQPGIKVMRIK